MKLSLIQDIPTPHNNNLIRELDNIPDIDLLLYYAMTHHPKYANTKNKVFSAYIYGQKINIPFILKILFDFNRVPIFVGWANINTMLLHFLFFIFRRKYLHWSDLPVEFVQPNLFMPLRYIAYTLLLQSNSIILAVGRHTVSHFVKIGFPIERVYNFPIFCDVPKILADKQHSRSLMSKVYGLDSGKVWLFAGSRLELAKGFDIFLESLRILNDDVKQSIQAVIVGTGSQEEILKLTVENYGLNCVVTMVPWLESNDFSRLLRSSDIVIQPSRNETYGIAALALANGVPVLGSTMAGASIDKVINGVNGFLFDSENKRELADGIEMLVLNSSLRHNMGIRAHKMELKHTPAVGANLLIEIYRKCFND